MRQTIAVAESCTGGKLADTFTKVPGASDYFKLGVVAYANDAKINVLKVPRELIETHGAVSAEVAEAMARNVREIGNTDIGLSTTGIAGPDGGTLQKPVGTVFIAIATKNDCRVKQLSLKGSREDIQHETINELLALAPLL